MIPETEFMLRITKQLAFEQAVSNPPVVLCRLVDIKSKSVTCLLVRVGWYLAQLLRTGDTAYWQRAPGFLQDGIFPRVSILAIDETVEFVY